MRFVTFHTTKETWTTRPHPYGGLRRPHTELIDYFLASVRATHPEARVTMLTDRDSPLSAGFDDVVRGDVPQQRLTLARVEMQRAYLGSDAERTPVVLLDTDTLVVRSLGDVFDGSFDVGVTIRDAPRLPVEIEMPYNIGVMFVDRTRLDAALSFLEALIERAARMPDDLHAWSGVQYAARDILGRRAVGETVRVGEARVRIFPCTTHNYTPLAPGEQIEGKYVLHFKGQRKELMEQYSSAPELRLPGAV